MIKKAVKNHGRLYAIASLGILLIVLIVSHNAIKQQLNEWKLLPEPERLTELYFTKSNSLPTAYTVDSSQVVSFTVHNLEYRMTDYHYQIVEYSSDGSKSQLLANGSFSLAQNDTAKRTVSIAPANLGSRVQIAIVLTNVNESIDYWVHAT